MPFIDLHQQTAQEIVTGFHAKFVHSDHMTLAYWNVESGAELPEHSHPHEQVCNVLEGEFELTIDGVTQRLGPGMVGVIPSKAVHSGRALTDCKIMDVFQPVRSDYQDTVS